MSSQPLQTPIREIPALDIDATGKLTEFARACKAAARCVSLYPSSHPAIGISLAKLSETTARLTTSGPVTLGVVPDNLRLDGCAASKPDQAIRETGALLHDHMIGLLTLTASPEPEGWLPFLRLLSRSIDDIRAQGGVSALWGATGQTYLTLEEIDYADILRDRGEGGAGSHWDDIVRACMNLDAPLDDATLRQLMEVCADGDRFGEFIMALEKNEDAGMGSKASALLRMLRGVLDVVSTTEPAKLEPVLKTMAEGMGKLSPELLMELLASDNSRANAAADLVLKIAARMTDDTLASFVARNVTQEGGATNRLAEAFQTLVPDDSRRPGLLEMAKAEVEDSPLGETEEFPELWKKASDILTSYTDAKFVSDSYARELSSARTQALEVERVSDDPPDRVRAWVSSISIERLRALDLQLLLDLLKIESDPERWRSITPPAVAHVEELLSVGDFEGALQLVKALAHESRTGSPHKDSAMSALGTLAGGPIMDHVVSHLRTVDDATARHIAELCHSIGAWVVKPLAEALSTEKRAPMRARLTELLIGFGPDGRQAVEQLKTSANPAVRRTAIYLLVEFGGADALPDLTALLDDAEPQIQREAIRAILLIGSEQAYAELQRALTNGSATSRESLLGALIALRSERAVPLFEYIIRKNDGGGPLRSAYLRSIESLGALKANSAVGVLKDVLYRRSWWTPLKTAHLRVAAAAALRDIGTDEARQVLKEAAASAPLSVRRSAKAMVS